MMGATLSVLGLWTWDKGLFDRLQLPDGVDKDTVISNILLEAAEFEILYPDPEFLKMAIGQWSKAMLPTWSRIWSALQLKYDPISNYDRIEHYETQRNRDGSSTGSSEGSVINSQQGDNVTGFVDASKNTSTAESGSTDEETENVIHDSRISGNVGVTTSQQMLLSEMEVAEINIYNRICQDFMSRFCLKIY